jgi:hypothetical protein
MKKLCIILSAALLISLTGFAGNGGDKGKDKKKKPPMTNCPGKQCSKKATTAPTAAPAPLPAAAKS